MVSPSCLLTSTSPILRDLGKWLLEQPTQFFVRRDSNGYLISQNDNCYSWYWLVTESSILVEVIKDDFIIHQYRTIYRYRVNELYFVESFEELFSDRLVVV